MLSTLTRHELKMRKAIAVILILLGLVVCVAGIWLWIISVHPPLGLSVIIILGVLSSWREY
jgi:uncharacterized membrane protein